MLTWLSDILVYDFLKLPTDDKFAIALHFFIYDTVKILLLIFAVVSIIAFIRTFFHGDSVKEWLTKAPFGIGNLVAALFGAVTPFCSCSSIPLFLGFLEARIPLGIAFSFLITSPLVNEVAFVIMGGLFGWKLAILYAVSGILLGIIGGLFLGSLKMEKDIILDNKSYSSKNLVHPKKFKKKLAYALIEGKKTLKKLYPFVMGGIAVGAIIHGFVPADFFSNYIGKYHILSVPIATLIGVPIYAGCSTVVPVIFGITANGVPLGTSLAFMMSIAGLSLPEAIILKRVMKFKLLLTFFGIVALGITIIGLLFNALTLT